jgi:hypothetical protein
LDGLGRFTVIWETVPRAAPPDTNTTGQQVFHYISGIA